MSLCVNCELVYSIVHWRLMSSLSIEPSSFSSSSSYSVVSQEQLTGKFDVNTGAVTYQLFTNVLKGRLLNIVRYALHIQLKQGIESFFLSIYCMHTRMQLKIVARHTIFSPSTTPKIYPGASTHTYSF